jgi:DNA-directed RNA polymerase specialized sigma24 family protein
MRPGTLIYTVGPVERAEALKALPSTYAMALRLRDEGVEPDAVARVLDVEPEAVGPLLTLAEAKLAGLMESQ